jgi:DSBA-like thioredoxin domain
MVNEAATPLPLPLPVTAWYDYHCPYSRRGVEWLLTLGPDRVRPWFRPFPLEQVNRDPDATTWRLWDQPLDYIHYRERQDRRPLHAFLATWVLEATESNEVVDRFRLAVYRARFDEGSDIADIELLVRLADEAGGDGQRLRHALSSAAEQASARADLATAWRDARSEYRIFGVPTLEWPGATPFYIRLERPIAPGDEAVELLERLESLRAGAPYIREIKLPERVEESVAG